jgi:hypothetical protein
MGFWSGKPHRSGEEALLDQEEIQAQKERRARKRYPVSARVRFRWKNDAGKWISTTGVTRDVSVAGAYILCPNVPHLSAAVEVQVAVTPLAQVRGKAFLYGRGFVTRINVGVGFAAELILQLFRSDQMDPTEGW